MKLFRKSIVCLNFILLVSLMLSLVPSLLAKTNTGNSGIGLNEKLGTKIPLNLTFFDEDSNKVTLGQYFKRPVILTFIYYSCPGICPILLKGEQEVLGQVNLTPGKDYTAITVSFDPRDHPKEAREKKRNYIAGIKRAFPDSAWHWLTGDSASIKALTDAVGFEYKAAGDGFIHPTLMTVLGADGKISRYMNGTDYLPFDLQMAVIEASKGKVGPTIAKVLRLCFNYDPSTNRYAFNFLRVSGALVILFALIFIGFITIKGKVKKSKAR